MKQIDEFFTRFNLETNYKGETIKDSHKKEEYKKNLLTLLNLEKFYSNNQIDSIANNFIDYIIENDIKIHYEDTTWYAKVLCSFDYEGKKYEATLKLNTEKIQGFRYKWVIADIDSPFFKNYPIIPEDSIIISPADHGIGFITLPETLNLNNTAVSTTFSKGYSRNYLFIFDYLMTRNKIKIKSIKKVIYHFEVKNYSFDVERIEKNDGYNQGWLINNIKHHEI